MRTIGQQTWICNSTVIYEIYDLITDASIRKKTAGIVFTYTPQVYNYLQAQKKNPQENDKTQQIFKFRECCFEPYMSQCPWDGLRYTKHKTREKLSYEYISLYLNTYFAFLATISIYYT